MTGVSTITRVDGGLAVLTIDNPPVNALGLAAREGMASGFMQLIADDDVKAIILTCAGRTFFAGADISEFGKPAQQPDLKTVFALIENATKPVIAAIHGAALGGGYETALICHYRIAVPSAKVGLPEVKLGLLPGAGGTQRLPRIVGVEAALDIIAFGEPIPAVRALELGMIDALAEEGRLLEDAISFARRILAEGAPLLRVRDRNDKIAPYRTRRDIYTEYLDKNARKFHGFQAPASIVKAIEAAVESADFEAGMARERELFVELRDNAQSAALRYYFFAERMTGKVPDVPPGTPVIPIQKVGVVGAGTMGGGIAMALADAGMTVTLVETDQIALDRGLSIIRRNYQSSMRKGGMTAARVEQRMALITPAIGLNSLDNVDLVVEAAFEEMAIKRDIFRQLDSICKPDAILASNTSFLDLDEIAFATRRPERVIGLHFFSPANVMRLLEVVRGERTSNEVVATAMRLAKQIGKIPVLSRVCPGFIANRVMNPYFAESFALTLKGPTPPQIDKAMYDYGFAMGPFRTIDLVGLDVIGRAETQRTLIGDLVKCERLGQKRNGGFYDYATSREATYSPVAADVIKNHARFKGIEIEATLSDAQIVTRLLYPVVNEGAKLLEEGIALRASDIDVAVILGYNWPAFTGGPMHWADRIGLETIVAGLQRNGFEPAGLLARMALSGMKFTE